MIDRDHQLSITRQAKLLEISRGTVYYLPRPVSEADLALMRKLDELHLEHPFMGARQLRDQLARQGIRAGRLHIRTLMLRMGIEALTPQPGTSKAAPGHKIYPYLLRKLAITRANQVWALDTTYIPMARGFVYLTAVVDVLSRCVLAHKLGRLRWKPFTPRRGSSRPLPGTVCRRSSIRTRAASSRRRHSPMPCWPRAVSSPWTGVAPGATTCSSSACGAA